MSWIVTVLAIIGGITTFCFVLVVIMLINGSISVSEAELMSSKPTNSDKIRSVSDDSLAEFLAEVAVHKPLIKESEYKKAFINWLKETV